MMHEISIFRPLNMGAPQAYAALRSILDAIEKKQPPYERTTLTVAFEGLGPPFAGRVSAPVGVKVRHNDARLESEITIAGAAAAAIFPTFEGTLSVNPLRDQGCEIWLEGGYVPPLGYAGEIVDRTLMNNAAHASLARMLEWLGGETLRCA